MATRRLSRRAALPVAGLGLLAVAGGLLSPGTARAAKHPRIEKALEDLKDVRRYLKNSALGFGGHKQKAIDAVTAAIDQLGICLKNG
jgi:hypothetical protein